MASSTHGQSSTDCCHPNDSAGDPGMPRGTRDYPHGTIHVRSHANAAAAWHADATERVRGHYEWLLYPMGSSDIKRGHTENCRGSPQHEVPWQDPWHRGYG